MGSELQTLRSFGWQPDMVKVFTETLSACCNCASFLYKNANPEEKQELLSFLLSHSVLINKKAVFSYTKPFDRISQRVSNSDWWSLRNDYRTMDWAELASSFGNTVKVLDRLLA